MGLSQLIMQKKPPHPHHRCVPRTTCILRPTCVPSIRGLYTICFIRTLCPLPVWWPVIDRREYGLDSPLDTRTGTGACPYGSFYRSFHLRPQMAL